MPTCQSANDQQAGRHEFKYRIHRRYYHALKHAVVTCTHPDPFTRRAGASGYFVRSLYFETADDRIYAQKLAGDCNRVKYRLRSYSADAVEAPPIRVELKVRRGESLWKYQSAVTFAECEQFLRRRCWETASDPVCEEFARGAHLMGLWPSVLVDYEREGYESRFGDGVRITFDHRVRSCQAKALFPSTPTFFRVHHSNEFVLEIKYRGPMPGWLRHLVQGYGLRLVANSKFSQGIEAGRRDRCYPDGVLVIR